MMAIPHHEDADIHVPIFVGSVGGQQHQQILKFSSPPPMPARAGGSPRKRPPLAVARDNESGDVPTNPVAILHPDYSFSFDSSH
jgi:hypothetical protein